MLFIFKRRRQGRHTPRAVAARQAIDRLHAEALEYDEALTYAEAVDYDQALTLAEAFGYEEQVLTHVGGEDLTADDTVVIDHQQVLAALRAG